MNTGVVSNGGKWNKGKQRSTIAVDEDDNNFVTFFQEDVFY